MVVFITSTCLCGPGFNRLEHMHASHLLYYPLSFCSGANDWFFVFKIVFTVFPHFSIFLSLPFLQYGNCEKPSKEIIKEWELTVKCARKAISGSSDYRIDMVRFVEDATSWKNTCRNTANVLVLIVHNKLKFYFDKQNDNIYLSKRFFAVFSTVRRSPF